MNRRRQARLLIAIAGAGWLTAAAGSGQSPLTPSAMRNHQAIRYQQTPPEDAVAILDDRLRRGEARLEFDSTTGYLRSVLKALNVSEDSQILVFSKTSFQARRIGPDNPRALFFNDTAAVGWVRGGEVLEFVAQDPRQGAIFYTLEQTPAAKPQFHRDLSCVQCHTWEATGNVPGMFLGSNFVDTDGAVLYSQVYSVDHRTPFEARWGGWYVTGRHEMPAHIGNGLVRPGEPLEGMMRPETVHVTSLRGRFDPTGYPHPDSSDIVALMVLEHQARLLNLITRAGWEARLGPEAGRPLGEAIAELADYMLFADEQPLAAPVAGTSSFADTFQRGGPRDSKGRSLRDLDLQTRLMRYPCSFLIYSAPFDALPDSVKGGVYARLWDVLSGKATGPRYAHLTAHNRAAIVEILRDTKSGLPDYFRTGSLTGS